MYPVSHYYKCISPSNRAEVHVGNWIWISGPSPQQVSGNPQRIPGDPKGSVGEGGIRSRFSVSFCEE